MSKLYPGAAPPELTPSEQIEYFANRYRNFVSPASLGRIHAHADELGLEFPEKELFVLAALDTPLRVQEFLDTEIYYNNDHATIEQEETALSPRRVLQTGRAHCFEGALFAFAVNYLHGYEPRWMLLEGSRDVDHNLVVYKDKHSVRWGCNAHSGYPHLNGRPPEFFTLRELAESYHPYYYSGYTNDPKDLTLVGYSEPYDLTRKFGVAWMASEEPMWDIYYTFVDDTWKFYYLSSLFLDSSAITKETHDYPLVRALKEGWISLHTFELPETTRVSERPFVNSAALGPAAQALWQKFWQTFKPADILPRGEAAEIEKQFFKLIGTTPIDLNFNAEELGYYLDKGYWIDQLITRQADGR